MYNKKNQWLIDFWNGPNIPYTISGRRDKQQREIQSACFGHNMFSIFTACCYISDAENKMICESVIITNELSDHSRAAAITRVLTVIGIWEKNISIYYWKLTLLYGVMVVLHSSGSDSVFNCYQVLIHLWALRGAIMKNITAKSLRMALEEL